MAFFKCDFTLALSTNASIRTRITLCQSIHNLMCSLFTNETVDYWDSSPNSATKKGEIRKKNNSMLYRINPY